MTTTKEQVRDDGSGTRCCSGGRTTGRLSYNGSTATSIPNSSNAMRSRKCRL
jgi:hypothetical protein